jgi:hypothetical protein
MKARQRQTVIHTLTQYCAQGNEILEPVLLSRKIDTFRKSDNCNYDNNNENRQETLLRAMGSAKNIFLLHWLLLLVPGCHSDRRLFLSLARASERESASHRNISKQKIQQRLFLLASVQIHALHSKDAKIPGSMKPVRSCSTTIPLDKKKIVRYEATSNLTVKINYSWCKSTELVSVLIT